MSAPRSDQCRCRCLYWTFKEVLFYAWLLLVTVKGDQPEVYTKNNPYELKPDKVFLPTYGQVFELYNSDGEIRNILVPASYTLLEYDFSHPDPNKHPPIYFNLYKNGLNEGIYVLKNKVARKIVNGTDSTFSVTEENLLLNETSVVYISANDGIYTSDPNKEELMKFGTITEEFKAIDKMSSDTDEIYVLAADNKIYKITSQGTVKTKVDGIDYAKDFAFDINGNIYFLAENNKPLVLNKDSTTPVEVSGLNFDVKNAFFCKVPSLDEFGRRDNFMPFVVDGVIYTISNNSAQAIQVDAFVQGLTAYSLEWNFLQFYGENGRIYMQDVLAEKPSSVQQKSGSSHHSHKVAFDRDVDTGYKTVKDLIRHSTK